MLAIAPTGAGKTCLFAEKIRKHRGTSISIAHRQELVGQMALALAKDEVRHRVIGPEAVVREIVQTQMEELGRHYFDPNARCAVAGVDTITSWAKPDSRQYPAFKQFCDQVTLWVQDEAHHLLRENKWGAAVSLFPNARGLGVTAGPERADGKGLGRHADGVFDWMVVGPTMRELINGVPDWDGKVTNYLTEYRIICPPAQGFDRSHIGTGKDGDFIRAQLAAETKKSSIIGDVVTHYLKFAAGKLGVTFAPDVDTATTIAAKFNEAGVPAEVVSAKTPGPQRREILRRFRRRQLLELVNVDLFGEGFDLPAIEVVSMARATQSFQLYRQQFGRALRLLEGKEKAIIIDHVGNVIAHGGPPDKIRPITLDRRDSKASKPADDVIPMRTCLNPECLAPYPRSLPLCPICGVKPEPVERSGPDFVDGDLYELSPEVLAAMRGEVARVDRSPADVLHDMQCMGHSYMVAKGAANRHAEKQEAQGRLRDALSWWGGVKRWQGVSDAQSYREFYFQFGIDVLSAQALPRADAEVLAARVYQHMGVAG